MPDRPASGKQSHAQRGAGKPEPLDDTALASLSRDDRRRLGIDAWEPSLLRELLTAENRLRRRK